MQERIQLEEIKKSNEQKEHKVVPCPDPILRDPYRQYKSQTTLLHVFAAQTDNETIADLLEHRPEFREMVYKKDKEGKFPIEIALEHGSIKAVDALYKYSFHTSLCKKKTCKTQETLFERKNKTLADLMLEKKIVGIDLSNCDLTTSYLSRFSFLLSRNSNSYLLTKISLNGNNLKSSFPNLVTHLRACRSLTTVHLENCNLDKVSMATLSPLILESKFIVELNLSRNNICYSGASILFKNARLQESKSLMKIDLSENRIFGDKDQLDALVGDLQLKETNLSNNFLYSLTEQEEKHKNLFSPIEKKDRFEYGFFRTCPTEVKSVFDSRLIVSPNKWVISLVTQAIGNIEAREHAMLYLQGMCSKGQMFLERYHIRADKKKEMAKVFSENIIGHEIVLGEFKKENYHSQNWSISADEGLAFKTLMNEQAKSETKIPFTENPCIASVSSKENCLSWAALQLLQFGIEVNSLNFPSNAAKGESFCLVM